MSGIERPRKPAMATTGRLVMYSGVGIFAIACIETLCFGVRLSWYGSVVVGAAGVALALLGILIGIVSRVMGP